MPSNLKVNTILPSTGTAIGIGTASGNVDVFGHIVGHNTPNISGINSITAGTFYGSGANLTNLPVPTTITVADESSDTTCNPLFVTTTSGNLAPKTGTNLTFNSSSGNLRTGSLFLGTGSNESKTQDGLILERNSGDGEVHITAGRSGGNYSGMQFYVAGGSGVTKRHQIDYQSNFRWYGADGTTERLRIGSDGTLTKYYNSTSTPQFYLGGTSQVNGIAAIGAATAAPLVIGRDSGNAKSIHCSGNIQMASGYGIDFSATSGSPSNGGELLDDYEEGNFTASLGGVSNWSSYSVTGQGHYVKIGKAVHININFQNVDLNNSASGNVIIFNLPFLPFVVNPDCRGVTSNYMSHKVQHANDGMIHSFYIHPTYGFMGQITKNNSSWTGWSASNFTATGVYIDFSATYFTAA